MTEKSPGRTLQDAIDQAHKEHVNTIGDLVYHWNLLHEHLGVLFGIAASTSNEIGMAIWYSVQSDRGQRQMLLAALRANNSDVWKIRPKAKTEIKWLADYVTNQLSDRRNDAIHAPCEISLGIYKDADDRVIRRFEVGPSYFLGNPRASKLQAKDLLKEFSWYAATAHSLSGYAASMVTALTTIEAPWPERPDVPLLNQAQSRAD